MSAIRSARVYAYSGGLWGRLAMNEVAVLAMNEQLWTCQDLRAGQVKKMPLILFLATLLISCGAALAASVLEPVIPRIESPWCCFGHCY